MLPQSAAMEEVLQLLGSDSGFATSVAAANTSAAAVAALLFVKVSSIILTTGYYPLFRV
jgi:energy-converting hydrogenase Eha subunit C